MDYGKEENIKEMDIVEFVEKILNTKLFDYQRMYLRAAWTMPRDVVLITGRDGKAYFIPKPEEHKDA